MHAWDMRTTFSEITRCRAAGDLVGKGLQVSLAQSIFGPSTMAPPCEIGTVAAIPRTMKAIRTVPCVLAKAGSVWVGARAGERHSSEELRAKTKS